MIPVTTIFGDCFLCLVYFLTQNTMFSSLSRKWTLLLQVSKPYGLFLSDENLETMRPKKDEPQLDETEMPNEVDNVASVYGNSGDVEPVQGDDNDYGDGDGEMAYGDGDD